MMIAKAKGMEPAGGHWRDVVSATGMIRENELGMNKLEARFARALDASVAIGIFHHWEYSTHKLRLADQTWYTPDFYVLAADGRIIFYEVKGFWRDDARVKLKVAADKYPQYWFVAVQEKKSEWVEEWIKPGSATDWNESITIRKRPSDGSR